MVCIQVPDWNRPAMEHLRGARRILRSSLRTPDVLSIRIGWSSPWPVVRLRMPYVEGITALEWLKSGSNALHPLASGLGVHAATLAKCGLRHRDFKLSNVVIEDGTRTLADRSRRSRSRQ